MDDYGDDASRVEASTYPELLKAMAGRMAQEKNRFEAEVEQLRAQVPPAEVVGAIADMWAERWGQVAGEDVPDFVTIVEDWLSTLPTQEAQP